MTRRTFPMLPILFFILVLQPMVLADLVQAAPTVACHCFQDRRFSPENPTAFDPYLLATVQNRLLAHTFSSPRKEIVSAKMGGTSGDWLWVAHWIARAARAPVAEVERTFEQEGSWENTATIIGADPEQLGAKFWVELTRSDESHLAAIVVGTLLQQDFGATDNELEIMRTKGATLKESILTVILAKMGKRKISVVWLEAKKQRSWGRLLITYGETVETIEAYLSRSLTVRSLEDDQ